MLGPVPYAASLVTKDIYKLLPVLRQASGFWVLSAVSAVEQGQEAASPSFWSSLAPWWPWMRTFFFGIAENLSPEEETQVTLHLSLLPSKRTLQTIGHKTFFIRVALSV